MATLPVATVHSSHQKTLVNAAAVLVKASFAEPEVLEASDATGHLLRDLRNAARLLAAVRRFRAAAYESHPLAQRPRAA